MTHPREWYVEKLVDMVDSGELSLADLEVLENCIAIAELFPESDHRDAFRLLYEGMTEKDRGKLNAGLDLLNDSKRPDFGSRIRGEA